MKIRFEYASLAIAGEVIDLRVFLCIVDDYGTLKSAMIPPLRLPRCFPPILVNLPHQRLPLFHPFAKSLDELQPYALPIT